MPRILIDHISVADIERALRKVERYAEKIDGRMNRLTEVLAKDGAEAAADAYGSSSVDVNAIYEGNGTSLVVAQGEPVVFLEFGAGDTVATPEFTEANFPFDISSGSYSRTEGSGEYDETGKWHFGKREYRYIYPRRGMVNAERVIEDNYESRAREVFKID